MPKAVLFTMVLCFTLTVFSQNLNHMQWYNAPEEYEIGENRLVMEVTPQSDYWRKTHYGFTVDDGPFYYETRGGEFEVTVKINGEYKTRYDQMGLMFRLDEKHWIKTGVEYVDDIYNFSTVITHDYSSWGVIALEGEPEAVWIKAVRRRDGIEIFYSLDGENYQLSTLAYFPELTPVMVGMMAASPDGQGFRAIFEDFHIRHLPDERRLQWLEDNQ